MITLTGKYNNDCKIFIDDVEEGAIELVQNILNNEISAGVPVRIMPDTHVGVGIVIGFTMPMTTMVNPNYIGVDIGCSVTTHKLNKHFDEKQFPHLDEIIRAAVPVGMEIRTKEQYNDWWVKDYFTTVNRNLVNFQNEWTKRFGQPCTPIVVDADYITALCKKVRIGEKMFYHSVGTLGGGNHFIELGEGTNDGAHYLTLHSGSRNFGLKVCKYHAAKMKGIRILPQEYHDEFERIKRETDNRKEIPQRLQALNEKYHVGKKEYLLTGSDMYEYLVDMVIAQTYARFNHLVMSRSIFDALGEDYYATESIHSMHNFIDTTDWIIRKGAIRAYRGEKMVIPFNMRDGLLICEGKSNADWNCSAPHGAGRVLARNVAMKTLSMEQFSEEMKGIYSTSVCKDTLDESPMAYKDKDVITEAIQDTAEIIETVKPLLNIKAAK